MLMLWHSTVLGSSLLYKNYIVRYDRGWDILCEPYVVKKDDWVHKIFRQKGELAHKDYREFSGIFKRLNPHVKDINIIRPGQQIDIPLRKLEHGSLPGQNVGIVTIPFVALKKVKDVVKQHSEQHTVKKGDTVSALLAKKYGRYGSKAYNEGVKLFKAANPQTKDLDRIYVGQKLYLPDPTIRDKNWYANMYDGKGNLRDTLNQKAPAKAPAAPPQQSKPTTATTRPRARKAPPTEKQKTSQGKGLADAAKFVGGQLQTKGTYYLPASGQEDFEMDLSAHPTLDLGQGPKLVFTPDSKIMKMDTAKFHALWPDMKPVTIDRKATTEQYVSAIFKAMENELPTSEELTFERQGVHVAVRAKWVRSQNEGRHLCITPIPTPEQQTPDAIRRYLEQNGIILKEILPGGIALTSEDADKKRHSIKNILAIAPSNQKDFVKTLSKALRFDYLPENIITFPYAGIQVQAYANLLSTNSGQEIVVDFGDLYGDAVTSIEKNGLNVVRIATQDSYHAIAEKIFLALGLAYEQSPTLFAAQRSGEYNTAITINGLLYSNDKSMQTLLTGADLHTSVTDMLSERGINVVVW